MAWVLNLGADLELANPPAFAPSTRLAQLESRQGREFLRIANRQTCGIRHTTLERVDANTIYQSWCPTPCARATARRYGVRLPSGPPLEVLQAVNHRAFAAGLGIGLPGATFVRSMAALDALLAEGSAGDGWLLKRPFGFSGRGRKRVAGPIQDAARRWAHASMDQYGCGLSVEPFVVIESEYALHGWIERDGSCVSGEPCRLVCDAGGGWQTTQTDDVDLSTTEARALRGAHELSAEAMAAAGYFGPFAVDAFRWREAGRRLFHPLSEINARYTMGWFAGMGNRQRAWIDSIRGDDSQPV